MTRNQAKTQKKTWKTQLLAYLQKQDSGEKHFIGPLDEAGVSLSLLALMRTHKRPIVLICNLLSYAERLTAEVSGLMSEFEEEGTVELLPESASRTYAVTGTDSPRASLLYRFMHDPPRMTVCSMGGLLSPAPSPETVVETEKTLKLNMEISMESLLKTLLDMDYDDELEVVEKGEFAKRGGIVDVFSPAEELPARLEFFGDTIDSIRLFDPATQLSCRKVTDYTLILRSGSPVPQSEDLTDFTSYVDAVKPLVVVAFEQECRAHMERFAHKYVSCPQADAESRFSEFLARHRETSLFLLDAAEAAACKEQELFRPSVYPASVALLESGLGDSDETTETLERQLTVSLIRRWLETGTRVVILGQNESELVHIHDFMCEFKFKESANLQVAEGRLPCGFVLPDLSLALLTEQELFSSSRRRTQPHLPVRKDSLREVLSRNLDSEDDLSVFGELEEGDYAVHVNFGICIYKKLTRIEVAEELQEVVELEFDDEMIVHIPVRQAHFITKYIGSRKGSVQLSKLSSSRWMKSKAEASESIRSLALDMLRMQAVRQSVGSDGFPADDLSQRLFEQSFPFQETPDQIRAASEIKKDMESNKPMDRLLCGDVGYGKTELAMRAVFKCIMAGKQAAVLVPTTILAQQHYFSFLERFSGTPVVIETLSRFKTKAEQTRILARLKEGSVDVVIGTHRLVQGDIQFKNLGLIVIDEEQRFGVLHKEELKRLRTSVDVLTMTATPIPRTLYFSLAGLRDLSTLMSAPVQRLPIKTIVAQSDDSVIAEAIQRELQRGGQVYYLHNRVSTIEKEAARLRGMFPLAKIGVGHGQMHEDLLENTMRDFIEGKLDILVCTTIIESGLDIPNANTILIDRADRFGLAELYQLRGRVGRWTRQAYAYFLLPRSGILAGDARKRISAIRRYTHLGAGFKLALRDLEIRGSGNILGAEQSGQINAIGFHLYCQLLKLCISQLKGEAPIRRSNCEISIDFLDFALIPRKGNLAAGFPPEYINSSRLRLEAYRRLAGIDAFPKLEAFANELSDRFGRMPPAANNLILCRKITLYGEMALLDSIAYQDGKLLMSRGNTVLKPNGLIPRVDPNLPPETKLSVIVSTVERLFSDEALQQVSS